VDTALAIASRRDERRTLADPLPDDVVRRLLDAGRLSGSSKNGQPWVFGVPRSRIAILVAGKGPVAFDAGRSAQSILLAAWAEGLASCPNGIADADAACAALDASEDETPVIVLSFGLPAKPRDASLRTVAEWSERANRKPLEDVVRWLQ
jgi:nitroreductase